MKVQHLIVVEPGKIELQETEIEESLKANEALVQGEFSIVSGGTEGAGFTGLVKEMPFGDQGAYPRGTGYGHLGKVLDVGEGVTMCKPGDRVLSFSRHASVVKADAARMALPVPASPGEHMVFARMAGVSISALRSSAVQPGDQVVVIGAGLVGNFAAQMFQLAGARVLVADLSPLRLEKAKECGLDRAVLGADLEEAVADWTGGEGAHTVVEAIGISQVIDQAVKLTREHGEVILLGSPRASATFDVTPMLLKIHLSAIRMIGALEWRWPAHPSPRSRDIESNYRQIVEWIDEGRLIVPPLLTHLLSPAECQRGYEGATSRQEDYLGVVFDWGRL